MLVSFKFFNFSAVCVISFVLNLACLLLQRLIEPRDACAGEGAGGPAAPSSLFLGGQEGQELSFMLNSFHLSYL